MEIPKEVLSKLEKLKNLKEGATAVGSFAEAENAAAKYSEMLLKWNLTEDELIRQGIKGKAQMAHEPFDLDAVQAKTEAGWLARLIQVLAQSCMCIVITTKTHRHAYDQGKITVVGEDHNVATVFYILEDLMGKIDAAWKIAWKEYTGFEKRNTFKRGFLRGAVDAIFHKLDRQKIAMTTAADPHNSSMALMIKNKLELAMEHAYTVFPNLRSKTTRSSSLSGRSGYGMGQEAGSRMDINKGSGGGKPKQIGY